MNIELKQNIWKSHESGLGFYCLNIYKCSTKHPNLKELLKNEILKEKELGPIETMKKGLKESKDFYGSILLKEIKESDFKTLDFHGLKSEITEYWESEGWGEDLPIFQKNFELAIKDLNQFELSNRVFYYLNMEYLNSNKLIEKEYNFFAYLVCIISTEKNNKDIITITFGLD